MKALVPLNQKQHIKGYKEAGAKEFYLGFYDPKWHEVFGEYADINRLTGYKNSANGNTFEQMLAIIDEVKQENLSIYVTFNSSFYSQAQLDFISRYMQPLYQSGVDGLIVSCPELIQLAKEYKVRSVISTIAGIYNSEMVSFYKKLGASRVILPRDLQMKEIEQIVQTEPNIEYEVFLMRNGCIFSDSNCLGLLFDLILTCIGTR